MSFTAPSLGVVVTTNELPSTSGIPTNTATAFVVGQADWGPANTYRSVTNLTTFDAVYGPAGRSTVNATLRDSVETMLRLGVPNVYVGRVVGPAPVNATVTLNDAGAHPTLVATADNPGPYGNSLTVGITVNGGNFTVTYVDTLGNVIATSPSLASQAAAITWSQTAPYITLTAATATGFTTNNPAAVTAALTAGADNYSSATLTQWQTALGLFPFTLGPGQVLAPGQTNTTLNGIWSALLSHAANNNRFACLDLDSASPVAQIAAISAINTAAYNTYGIFDQPSAIIPGPPNSVLTRTVPASAVRAGLCAMADATGNPNRAAAGRDFPIPFVIGFNWYGGAQPSDSNVLLLNQSGINSFELRYQVLESYGFSTPALPAAEAIYWQASRSRLRMALVADAYAVGEPFVFGQIDGKGVEIGAFGTAIASMLSDYYTAGALYGRTAAEAFSVNVGPSVNTPDSIAAGELKAAVAFRPSPFAQMVEIDLSAVPTTQSLPIAA